MKNQQDGNKGSNSNMQSKNNDPQDANNGRASSRQGVGGGAPQNGSALGVGAGGTRGLTGRVINDGGSSTPPLQQLPLMPPATGVSRRDGGSSRESAKGTRPISGKKILSNSGINGIKPSLALDSNKNSGKQQINGLKPPPLGPTLNNPGSSGPTVTLGEDLSPSKQLLNNSGQIMMGTQNMSFENSQLLSPNSRGGSNSQMINSGAQKPVGKIAGNISNIPNNNNNRSSTSMNQNKIAPLPNQADGQFLNVRANNNYSQLEGLAAIPITNTDMIGRQKLNIPPHISQGYLSDENNEREGFSTRRKDPQSLRSSFDYIDVNMNEAMKAAGEPTLTGRASRFFKKAFEEDNWSGDESVFNKQMKMPNINANRADYQKEIGLNIELMPEPERTQKTDERQDTCKEAREMLPDTPFYKIVKKDRIQIINEYHDRCPLLDLRKEVMRWRVYINRGAQLVVMHPLFETISITVIVVNSLFLAMDDPLRDPSETPLFMNIADDIFQYMYTVEMIFKIVSMGFIYNQASYLRDAWNILDFTIIASGYIGMFLSGSGANLSVLRSFRVIRPLRTISSIQGLRIIVASLINAIPLLRDSILVLMFFFLIFAIAGCQLFTGALKNRCFNEDTGIRDEQIQFCGGGDMCTPGYYCGKSNENPANGATNFDNVMFSLMQVFQIVTMEGWTAIMVPLQQSVGTWIFIYFYPIIFIGAFFLLNLTLAVIKAKFTEEMNNKREAGGPAKKKRLDDASESSEDEEVRAKTLQEQIDKIKISKQMSPRSKENLINKIKIEHMMWQLDNVMDRRDVQHKVIEKTDEDELISKSTNPFSKFANQPPNKSFYSSKADKISILQPHAKALSYAVPKTMQAKNGKVQPALNYSEVFYSNKATVFHLGRSPRENLRDIFSGTTDTQQKKGSTLQKPGRIGSPIREDDEEEQDRTGLLDGEESRMRRRNRRPNSGGRNYSDADLDGPLSQSQPLKPLEGVSKWLGKVFEAKREANNGETTKKLMFAGMKNTNARPGIPRQQSLRRNPQEYDERMKRAVYENITRNFDIFEFLDDNAELRNDGNTRRNDQIHAVEGDDEMSDELEFEIDNDPHMESLYFDTDHQNGNNQRRQQNVQITPAILDLEDDEDTGGVGSRESGDPTRILKRGSTQATAAEGRTFKQNSSEQDPAKYTSPFMQSVQRQASLSPRDEIKEKRSRVAANKKHGIIQPVQPDLVYRGRPKGIIHYLQNCRKIKAKRNGRDFKEEYLLLKKRAKSHGRATNDQFGGNNNDIASANSTTRNWMTGMKDHSVREFDDKQADFESEKVLRTVRAKSIENKRKRLLAESIRFQRRIEIMRARRAQFFAPAIKMIGIDREHIQKEWDEYVLRKRKIKVDGDLINEEFTRKGILYRNASCEAIIRYRDLVAFAMANPVGKNVRNMMALEMRSIGNKSREGSLHLDSQRSEFLEDDYEKIVDNYVVKQEEYRRHQDHEDVPPMEEILQDRFMKIRVRMTNHNYGSIQDVFEKSGPGRYMTDREKAILEKERKKREALKMNLPQRIPGRDMIIGYQKKIFVQQKQFHEELLRNEFEASDEDQDGMLDRIEGEYNYDHRSHIFVTGTVSVVVNKPHTDNKIMNPNYHANIKAINQIKEQEEQDRIQAKIAEQQLNESKSGTANGKRPKVVVLHEDNQSTTRPAVEGSAWQRIDKMNFSQNASGMSMMRAMKNASRYSISVKRGRGGSVAESNMGKNPKDQPPKPVPLTDKQILKRLNEEVTRSRIFKALNIKKLPEKIIRRMEVDKGLFKKKKKKAGDKKDEEDFGDDEGSEGEDDPNANQVKKRKVDYFLDRPVDGNFHISMAKDAAFRRHKDLIEWSGQDIMARFDPYKARIAVSKLNQIRVWPYGFHGFVKKRRVLLKALMNSSVVEHGMTLCVLGNTVVLSLDYYNAPQNIQDFCQLANTFFTLTFAAEMGLRITAVGPAKWLADKMNYMDGTIVILSLVELIFMSGSGALSALRAVRIFRVFRVLRVARLLRGLRSMVQIINVISRSISSFIYLAMLLILFIFIYALLGMQIFGGAFTDPEVIGTVRYNFDSFNNSFITSFILLTTENWNTVMFYAFSSTISQFLIAIYFVSCIFIGNWMLLNLFLAILLDSFTAVEEEDMMTPEKKEAIKEKMLEDLKLKEGEDFIEGMEELQKEGFILKADKKPKKKKKKKKKSEEQKKKEAAAPAQMNILEESQEVDLQELARRDMEILELRKQLFRGVECERSMYMLQKTNFLRIFCYKVIHHGKFETFVMILIVFSSFKLVFDTYTTKLKENDPLVYYSSQFDLVFQALFTLEMATKIIAFGFVMDENSYLTDAWNKLDGFIVISGLIDTSMEGVDIPVIKILRLLRILRPLRFVSHSSSMKTLIEALMASMGSIFNVGVVIVIVFMMFAILGVNLFAGKLQSCTVNYYEINNQQECFEARGQWKTYDQNMDNVINAMLTLFVVSNNEGWPDVMYMYCDATGVETGPKPGAGIINAYFFIFFVFVGSFFFMNLFVGVLFLNFEKAQRDEKEAMLLDGDEIKWVDMMKMICDEKPEIIKIPKNPISRYCYEIVKDDSNFANFIMACIILNIFTMAAIFEGQSESYSMVLEKINYFFTGSFAIECGLKLIANGSAYFGSSWNKFDFFVVSASFLDIVMANMSANSLKVIRVGPQLARIMRVMRVSRLFKLLNKYKGLQALIQTITFSMPSVINAFALLTLVYFIFSVLAVFFFKDIIQGTQLDPDYMNFSNFTMALVMMLRLSTGEDWPSVMYDCMNTQEDCIPDVNCGTGWAPIFYMAFVLIQQYIMVNLFILIILQQFDLYYLPDDNVLDRFKADVTNFKFVWRRYSKEFEGFKIRGNDVQKFFKDLKGDLGMSNEKDQRSIERNLVIMNIQADDDGFIYFNELLYKTMKRRYAPGRTKKKILFEVELQTLEKLEKIMKAQIFQSRKKERQKAVAVNPFLAMMYKNMSFNVWRDIFERNFEKRMQHIALGLEREISDEEEEEEEEDHFDYETEEDEIIDEMDQRYLEELDLAEAAKADPGVTEVRQSTVGLAKYDQLKQEEEILGAVNRPPSQGIKKQ